MLKEHDSQRGTKINKINWSGVGVQLPRFSSTKNQLETKYEKVCILGFPIYQRFKDNKNYLELITKFNVSPPCSLISRYTAQVQ